MDDLQIQIPEAATRIYQKAAEIGFNASCDILTGGFLRALAASKKQARILELGTGVGYSTSWIVEGMDQESKLTTVEMNVEAVSVAMEQLGKDKRIEFIVDDGENFIRDHSHEQYDIVFADTWPGKFYLTEEALAMVKPGGIYLIDDLNPQPNWPEGHGSKVVDLIAYLETRNDFFLVKLDWSTGLILMTKK